VGHWIVVDLQEQAGGSTPLGTRVDLYTGGLRQTRNYDGGQGNRSQESPRIHFGMGSATMADSLVVTWPDGSTVRSNDVPADRVVALPVAW
jgi:hypothetical protein